MNQTATTDPSRQSTTPQATGVGRLMARARNNPLVPLLMAGAAVVAIIIALLLWASSPEYRVLFNNLSEADGGRIISELDKRAIPYRFSEGGHSLLVPGDQVHSLRLQLAEQGLPQSSNSGFSLLDEQAFGISQFAEQINFQRALEGELASSIESLGPVARARVHLAMAKSSVFIRDQEPAKASVVLNLHPGRFLDEGQISAIVHMVSGSVPELAAADVTLVDQRGKLLSRSSKTMGDLDGTQLGYIEEVERSYQQRIENILAPIMGAQNVRAQVAAEIDFSRREETSERFSPNQGANPAAVRSAQHSANYQGMDELARGIPGALSNVPPGSSPSPIEQPADAAQPSAADAAYDQRQSNKVINYEVDRNISHIKYRRGHIKRLSVAVVVNYRALPGEGGEYIQTPLSDTELDHITRLARQAMGFSEVRGDQLEVVNSLFIEQETELAPLEWWESPSLQWLTLTFGRYLLVGLAALLLYLLLLRPLLRRYAPPQEPTGIQVTVGDEPNDEAEPEPVPEITYEQVLQKRKTQTHEQQLALLRKLAQDDPRLVAMIIRSWINKYE
ncbi:flagellar basal-body MS-ring/collar protein FliF [Zobellella maritima]|uniref:flagellar basal-body MS-ring/collar protein FliF n=1 Tax=Zobellella maritima TaxID=2059725 RepID=UPI000E3005DD|nr:flagellar basal-body MS-ring/collar protein FliF [Zobellella maritima]